MKRIHVFVYVRIRARWIGPYAWRNVSWVFSECSPRILWLFRVFFTVCSLHFGNLSAMFWQSARSCRGRFIVPANMNTPTKWETEMYVRWFEYTYLIMRICIFVYVRIRARWIGPYAWRNVSWVFAECSPCISWADVALLTIRSECLHGMFATCSLSVCYIFAMQKGGFCATKVWFLACKNPLFTLQKPTFWNAIY